MSAYKAAYTFVEDGVHAYLLDFPSAATYGADLDEARRMMEAALEDMAAYYRERGQSLPPPDPALRDVDADLEEPVELTDQ